MYLLPLTAHPSAAKATTIDPQGTSSLPAHADAGLVSQQDFSKYFSQIMKAGVSTRHPDLLRQELAGHDHLLHASQGTDTRNPQAPTEISRDARFASPRTNSADTQRPAAKSAAKPAQTRKAEDIPQASENEVANPEDNAQLAHDAMPVQVSEPALKTVALSPQVNIITSEKAVTSEESLAEHARRMGMDELTIQKLLNPNPSSLGVSGVGSPVGNNTHPLSNLPQAPGLLPPAPAEMGLPTDLSGNSLVTGTSPSALSQLAGLPLSQALKGLVNGAPSAKDGGLTTPSLGAADLSDIAALKGGGWKGLDNVVLMVSSLTSANLPTTQPVSTLAVLSMMDHQLSIEAIDALAQSFEDPPAIDFQEPASTSGFVSMESGRASAAGKTPAPVPAPSLPANMAETYEKLSAKLSTELAARMHQQISAGEWKMKFALKPASLGAVDIQLEMRNGKLAAMFQADNPLTQDLLQHGSSRLKQALSELGLTQTSVQVGQGQGQHAGQSYGQSATPSRNSKFGENDNHTKFDNSDEPAPARRTSLSQFDLYA